MWYIFNFVKINTFISIAGRLKYAIASPHYNLIGHWQWKLYIYARAKIRAIVVSIGVSHMYRAAHYTQSLIMGAETCPQPPYLGFLFLLPFFTGLWLIDVTSWIKITDVKICSWNLKIRLQRSKLDGDENMKVCTRPNDEQYKPIIN